VRYFRTCLYNVIGCTGDYGIHVKYNDEHVPNSPAFVHIAPESKDAALVTVMGLKDRGLEVRQLTFLSLLHRDCSTEWLKTQNTKFSS